MYEYQALVLAAHDGDTITARIDLGFHVSITETFRLSRINAPEVIGPTKQLGIDARDFVRNLILNKTILIKTEKDKQEKYGRYLADVYLADGRCLNDLLVDNSLAIYQRY
jgi:micrococcal nuclease